MITLKCGTEEQHRKGLLRRASRTGVCGGPWGCYCGWSSDSRYNQLRSDVEKHTDPFGFYYPTRADRAQ